MKKVTLLLACLCIFATLLAQQLDTSLINYRARPDLQLIRQHRAVGHTLTAVGLTSMGIGIGFGAKAILELQKELYLFPLLAADEKQMNSKQAQRYFAASLCFLGVGIPLLVIGSKERRKAKVLLYGKNRIAEIIPVPSTEVGFKLVLSISR